MLCTVDIIIFTSLPTLLRNTGIGQRTTGMLPSSSSVSSSTWSMWLVRLDFFLQINCFVCWALEKFLTLHRQIYFPDLLRWLLPRGRVHDIRKWCRLHNNKNHHYHHHFHDNHHLMISTMHYHILAINLTRFGEWCRKSLRNAPTPWPWFSQRFDICTGFERQ